MNCDVDSCSDGDEGVDFPTLGLNRSYEGGIFALLCFDGLVCVPIVCEHEFYSMGCQVGERYE